MVSSGLLFITLCVFAVYGQDGELTDTYDYEFDEYSEEDESGAVDFGAILLNWLADLMNSNACDPNPCLNGGQCNTTQDGSFECSCPIFFTGSKCETVRKVCKNAKCGRGECLVTTTEPFYECKCNAPYKPPICKKPFPCQPSPCLNGGTCKKGRTRSSFSCDCPNQYTGKFCHVDPNDCYEHNGESYRGNVSDTEAGHECLNWHSYFVLENGGYPYTSFESFDGFGPHNYCRNPDGDFKPWCFVNKHGKLRWDHCNVRSCSESAQPTSQTMYEVSPTSDAAAKFANCGKPLPTRSARIYGGRKSLPGAHPWQVSMQIRPKGSAEPFGHFCGGILIKSCWVLTAAHCINNNSDVRVVLGGVDIEKDEEFDQTIDVENAIIHENYRDELFGQYNDIALLKLKGANDSCTNETRFVKTACLPSQKFADGTECVISGWGVTEKNKHGSNKLLDAPVVLISQERCKAPNVYGDTIDNSMFCAGNMKGKLDSCQGDSGGPLVCQQNGTHYVTGVVSWGDGCGEKDKPGVYTDVRQFVDWISSKVVSNK